jgi:hypothetical protein
MQGLVRNCAYLLPPPRICKVQSKPNPEHRFICYDIAPDTDLTSYFEKYLQDVESVDGCEGEFLLNNNTSATNDKLLGHTTSSMLYSMSWGTVLADSRVGETFDPALAAALSINTMLIEDPISSADSTTTIGVLLSRIFVAIISVSMVIIVE